MKNLTCLLLAGCFLVSCSSKEDSFPTREKGPDGKLPAGSVKTAKSGGIQPLQILQIAFVPPKPTANDDLRAIPSITDGSLARVEYRFQWFVNLNEATDADGEQLGREHFKKKDWVYCRVQAVHFETNRESAWVKSSLVGIGNSQPEIEPLPVEAFSVPGVFRYRVRATDPDDEELTYRLLSPLDAGIRLDSGTGQLEWKLDETTVKKFGEAIEIRFEAADGDGGAAGGSIQLNLRSQEQSTTSP